MAGEAKGTLERIHSKIAKFYEISGEKNLTYAYLKDFTGIREESDRDIKNVLKQKFNAYERNGNVFGLKRKKNLYNFAKTILLILNWIKDLLFILGKISLPIAFFLLGYGIYEQRPQIEKAFEVSNILSIVYTSIVIYLLIFLWKILLLN